MSISLEIDLINMLNRTIMKRTASLILLILNLSFALAQNPTSLEGWAQRLQLFGQKLPQEEVFVHMDNSCYYLGDTIYFKAYMRLSDGKPSSLSRLLYVELFNNDGYLVERQKIEMNAGTGYGSFVLPDTIYSGYYELRAYTRWQLNWGRTEHPHTTQAEDWFFSKEMAKDYYRDYEKLYSRVFPVYDHPREAGDYAQEMTLRPLQRLVAQKEEKPKAVVTFYPEGGNLVAGVKNRIAFEANDEDGRHLKGTLTVGDQNAETFNRGRGAFFTDGMAEKCTFKWEGGTQEVRLPKPVQEGVALQADVQADGIHLTLFAKGKAAQEPLGLTVSSHGVQKDFQQLGPGGELSALVPLEKLPTGVIQLTVFNAEGRIYADRLVFVRQPDFTPQNITISGVKNKYEPYEQIELNVETLPQPSLSLAVRDAAHSDYTFDSGNMLTEMLLASQIRGFVENPAYFFEADDEEHKTSLDLLLMVQGWRRYSWQEMATPGAFAMNEPYERTEVLTGDVNPYMAEEQEDLLSRASFIQTFIIGADSSGTPLYERPFSPDVVNLIEKNVVRIYTSSDSASIGGMRAMMALWGNQREMDHTYLEGRLTKKDGGNLKNEVLLHAEFVQPGVKNGLVEGEMPTFNKGHFKIEAPRFYQACHFSLAASDTTKWKSGKEHTWVAVNEDAKERLNYPEFYVRLKTIFPRFVKPYSFYQTAVPQARTGKQIKRPGDDVVVMDEVTVRASRRTVFRKFDPTKPAFVLDAYDAFNQTIDAGLCPGYYTGARRFVDDIARTFVGDMGMERAYIVETRINTKPVGAGITLFKEAELQSTSLSTDPRYNNIQRMVENAPFVSLQTKSMYDHLPRLDKVYVFTDYAPRREGSGTYTQSNQPTVVVDLHRFEDGGQRMTWRDRRMVLTGFAVCEDFYQPDYSKQRPTEPTDYRRTLYWNPNVELDAQGHATIRFYNNSRSTRLTVSAEGMTKDGQPLTGISYPEDR